ncbi:MAG: hypothetical protein NTV54_08240 [Ignavibacteriales bacterium]|nr:hypothetical protein [Ignavibacteriales bacterium]
MLILRDPQTIRLIFGYLLCFVFLTQSNASQALAQDRKLEYLSPTSVLSFAEWLYFVDHDYGRAGDEYYRYLFLAEAPNDSIQFRLALCRKKEGKLQIADELFRRLDNERVGTVWRTKAIFQSAHIAFLSGNYAESNEILERKTGYPIPAEAGRFKELRALNYLAEEQWDSAKEVLNLDRIMLTADSERRLSKILSEGQLIQRKSPWLAGGLSLLIPGAGKVYTSEWQDGLYSLLYVAFTGYLSYSGFNADGISSVKGWIFGCLSATLYAGNVFGAVQSAQVFNVTVKLAFLEKIKRLGEDLGYVE